jgi:hypothetical protein
VNITNVLHRSRTGGVDVALDTGPAAVAPNVYSLERGPDGGARWPRGVVMFVLVALLAIAVVLGAVVTVGAFSSGDDGATERKLRGQVATLTTQRGDALEDIAALDGELASLRRQLEDAQAGADGFAGQVGVLEARIVSLSEQRDVARSSADALEAELTVAQRELAATQQRLTDVMAERDAFARLFPMEFAPSLDAVGTAGTYGVAPERIYCVGLTTCGSTPTMSDLTIRTTPEGYLRANIPGFVEGGLFRADGAMHLVADSAVAVPSCAGVTRTAGVTMTIFPGGYEIARDGSRTNSGLNAVITVEAPAVGSCPAVLAFTSAELTRLA